MVDAHAAANGATPPTTVAQTRAGSPGTSGAPDAAALEDDITDSPDAMALPPQQSVLDWVAYTVSLNYNRV